MQDVCGKLLRVSDVFRIVENDKMVAGMVVEDTLKLVCSAFDVLLPLGFEKLQALRCHYIRVLLLEVVDSGDTLVEGRIGNLACDGDFDGRLRGPSSNCSHL